MQCSLTRSLHTVGPTHSEMYTLLNLHTLTRGWTNNNARVLLVQLRVIPGYAVSCEPAKADISNQESLCHTTRKQSPAMLAAMMHSMR